MKKANIDKEIDKKIEEFFFEPESPVEEYNKLFTKNNPGDPIRRSPLYTARRDIYYCFGIDLEGAKHIKRLFTNKFEIKVGPAYFAGIWLIWETLETLAKICGCGERDYKCKDRFIADFLEIEYSHPFPLRMLRNGLTHYAYGLKYRYVSKDKKRQILFQFNLSPSCRFLIREDKKSEEKNRKYIVNPIILHQKFEQGIAKLKAKLIDKKNKELRKKFNESSFTKRSNWVKFE